MAKKCSKTPTARPGARQGDHRRAQENARYGKSHGRESPPITRRNHVLNHQPDYSAHERQLEASSRRRLILRADEAGKLQHLKVKIEVICEAGDVKKISDLLKELSNQG